MTLIYLGLGLIALWLIVRVGFKMAKWSVYILLILAALAFILKLFVLK